MIDDLKSFTDNYLLTQQVTGSTHKDGNTLDLIFTNNKRLFHSFNTNETLQSVSHHKIIEVATLYKSNVLKFQNSDRKFDTPFDKLNYFSEDVDWDNLNSALMEYNWSFDFKSLHPTDMLNKLYDICEDISLKTVPPRKSSSKAKTSNIPKDRRILMRRRRKINKYLNQIIKNGRRSKLLKELREIEKKLQDSYKAHTTKREQVAIQSIKRNSKYFFTYAKKFSKIKSSIGPLKLSTSDEFVYENKKMADILKGQYTSVFSTPTEKLIDPQSLFIERELGKSHLCDIVFDEDNIIEAIDSISPNSAAGPDGFPALLLKQCKYALAKPLYLIWRKCLDLGITPNSLKLGLITPIHKGGSSSDPVNYRPIALTSHIIKLFEKVVRTKIVEFLDENKSFNPSQHGFRSGRSCLSQLIAHHDKILSLLEEGHNVDVVYLDFSKAFDKLDFNITLKKLHSLGISGKLGKWLFSFLTDRYQTVVVNGEKSDTAPVISGVPQGSVLGPLLFLILLGDIDEGILYSFLSSFADDSRLGKGIISINDTMQLQQDLITIYEWSKANNMSLNDSKFELLRYGHNKEIKNSTHYLSNNGTMIEMKEHVKDLGVYMSSDATFNEHISNLVITVKDLTSWILRTFKSRGRTEMLTLWKAMIIPRLDYCSQLWNPSQTGQIQQLEEIQRSFIRKIRGSHGKDYWEDLDCFNLYSLQRRRERYRVIYTWSILEKIVPNFNDGIVSRDNPRIGRTCFIPAVKNSRFQSIRYASFKIHGPRLFNSMPKSIRNLSGCSKDFFKKKLDRFLSTVPDEPLIRGYTSQKQASSNSLIDMVKITSREDLWNKNSLAEEGL